QRRLGQPWGPVQNLPMDDTEQAALLLGQDGPWLLTGGKGGKLYPAAFEDGGLQLGEPTDIASHIAPLTGAEHLDAGGRLRVLTCSDRAVWLYEGLLTRP